MYVVDVYIVANYLTSFHVHTASQGVCFCQNPLNSYLTISQ